jgi:predicted secreted hydrolase
VELNRRKGGEQRGTVRRRLAPLLVLLAFASAALYAKNAAVPVATAPKGPANSAHDAFLSARPGYVWNFPRDTGSHPGYRTEWWYYTGRLLDAKRREYGYELTFFRSGLSYPPVRYSSAWGANDLYFAHFAVVAPAYRSFDYDELASRGALGLANAATGPQNVWLKTWSARREGETHRLLAEGKGWRADLRAVPLKPPALHGLNGYSQKGAGATHASYYYSYTRMKTVGTLWRNGEAIPVTGESWMDHEFSTDSLAPDEIGWDWFSVQLSDDEEFMLYRMRRRAGGPDPHSGGSWVDPAGKTTTLRLADYGIEELNRWTSPKTKIVYPSEWSVRIPSKGLLLRLKPVMANQELVTQKSTGVTYWEGAIEATGTLKGKPVRGRGYVELTGYGDTLSGRA